MYLKIVFNILTTENVDFFVGGFVGAFVMGILPNYDSTRLMLSAFSVSVYLLAELIMTANVEVYFGAFVVLIGTLAFGTTIGFLANYLVSKLVQWALR